MREAEKYQPRICNVINVAQLCVKINAMTNEKCQS